ncbi:hypothetical protein, partial [Dysgonomonas sp.]
MKSNTFDIEMIRKFYESYPKKVDEAKKILKRPLTLSEKILYAHLSTDEPLKNYVRATDYVNFSPDRVAMQDATA